MYQIHGWFHLALSSYGEDDEQLLDTRVKALRQWIESEENEWANMPVTLRILNGHWFLSIDGLVNHMTVLGAQVGDLVARVAALLPGSYGLLYERSDEMPDPPGDNAFRVSVMRRGQISQDDDPFLSPCIPLIDDDS